MQTRAASSGNIAVHAVPPPPPKDPDARQDAQALAAWYRETATTYAANDMTRVVWGGLSLEVDSGVVKSCDAVHRGPGSTAFWRPC